MKTRGQLEHYKASNQPTTVFVFIDEWKTPSIGDSEAKIGYYARLFTSGELFTSMRPLNNVWANCWHASAKGNYGLTRAQRPLWIKTAKSIVTALSLPAIYQIAPQSKYKTPQALALWREQAYPKVETVKGITYGNRSQIPLHKLIKGTPLGIAFYEFCVHSAITCIELLQASGSNPGNLEIKMISDHVDFFLPSGQNFMGPGEEVILGAHPKTKITLRFSNRKSAVFDYAHFPLGLVDSECYMLGAFHIAAEKRAGTNKLSIEELTASDVSHIISNLPRISSRDYTNFLISELRYGRIISSRWGVSQNPELYRDSHQDLSSSR